MSYVDARVCLVQLTTSSTKTKNGMEEVLMDARVCLVQLTT